MTGGLACMSSWRTVRLYKDDTVGVGEPIGLTGATGLVTGEHLHFSIKFNNRFLNPLAFLKSVLQRAASHYSLNYANHE
jgi:murein DD-endopeptidase MepM/ murein hydrolase activator NlpD